jgi:hypothetical protein
VKSFKPALTAFSGALLGFVLLAACTQAVTPTIQQPAIVATTATPFAPLATSDATVTPQPSLTATKTPIPDTATPTSSPTAAFPAEGRGPDNFAPEVNPLTGLQVQDPGLLERRPMVIKVENIPREHRPQWGLSLADLVYEYYTEFGATRFAAVFYGQEAQQVGPIRSGRFFDSNVVQMYKAMLVYGSAYPDVNNRFFNSDFANRLILETNNSCPGLCRYDPNGQNLLVADTASLQSYFRARGVNNSRQNLDGMFFQLQLPQGGDPAPQLYVRYSGAIYNRWDYDPASGRYLRFADAANDVDRQKEVYNQLTDRLTNQPVAADNVVMLCVPHSYYVKREDAEVLDIIMDAGRIASYVACDGQTYKGNSGPAYVARDGRLFKTTWQRADAASVLTLANPDGSLFPFKPGQTWFEVLGAGTRVEQQDEAWRFQHIMGTGQ